MAFSIRSTALLLALILAAPLSGQVPFLRGDADGDGTFNGLSDGIYILTHQFLGGPPPPCLESADADDDAVFNGLIDAIFVLTHQFLGGPAPAPPYPECGVDPDPDTSE